MNTVSVATYNVHKRRSCEAPRIVSILRRLGMGQAVICLQEIPRWTAGRVLKAGKYVVHSSRTKDDELANRDGFDCGFLVPGSLNPRIRDEQYGRYWSGMVFDMGTSHALIFSVHFIHINRNDGDTTAIDFVDEVREETLEYWKQCKRRFGEDISVVTGFDANVTLPPRIENVTGESVLSPLKLESMVLDASSGHTGLEYFWRRSGGLRALDVRAQTTTTLQVTD